jgi:hypothetical protein
MANTVDKVLKVAQKEVGYLEKSRASYVKDRAVLYEKTKGAGSDNYTKYGKEMHDIYPGVMDFPAAWCDCFVDWCFYTAYGVTNAKGLLHGDFNDYTVASAQLYKNHNAWYTEPRVGDQIFFNNGSRICHTGIVVDVQGGKVYTIEGNTSNAAGVVPNGGCVAKKEYAISSNRISGYGRPNYDKTKVSYFKQYKGFTDSIVMALASLGYKSDFSYRSHIALANGIKRYSGSADENTKLLKLLKKGKLIKP